ncbi:MAG: hypothetical protein ACJ8GN_07030 [Longimicrobiaceae bacterium]
MTKNPFEVTKASDFSDQQIAATWVDLPGGGFSSLADPCSPMPRFLVGGKGGGRTHLLRYFSYPLQRLRHEEALLDGIQSDGYVGIYFRASGLNALRFADKGQDPDTWQAVFSFFTEVWLARLALDVISDILSTTAVEERKISDFVDEVRGLFDIDLLVTTSNGNPVQTLRNSLHHIQRQLDTAINNAALTRRLDISIGVSPGRLVFGIPTAAAAHLPVFKGLVFAYILDEFENITEDQQRYVNTLIREKQLPTTFLVGSRQYGLRTHMTLSAGEENKRGSEYDLVVLEDVYRKPSHKYMEFCSGIIRKRLEAHGYGSQAPLSRLFSLPDNVAETIEARAALYVQERRGERDRSALPWIEKLRRQLTEAGYGGSTEELINVLLVPESPLHEKFAFFLLYRAWASGRQLYPSAVTIRERVLGLIRGRDVSQKTLTTYMHYRHDLYAQLLDDLQIDQEYYGIIQFVRMSGYLPRNLIVVLKQVTRWSVFLGDRPFSGTPISLAAQREGVREASKWFLEDAKPLGRIGEETQIAIRRLGGLLRDMRFSDKPVEVSCAAFSTDRQGLSTTAIRTLDEAIVRDLLLRIPTGRRERNSQVLHHKYQLNPMLGPIFDLPLGRRGSAKFTAEVLNAIFDPEVDEGTFNSVRRRLLSRMEAPFQGETSQSALLLD